MTAIRDAPVHRVSTNVGDERHLKGARIQILLGWDRPAWSTAAA